MRPSPGRSPQGSPLRISTAASVTDTGLIQALADNFRIQHPDIAIVVRTGGALAVLADGRRGHADLVITHHRPSEELFVEQGYRLERVQFMYDEFAIFGPPADPLKLARDASLLTVLKRLALARAPFLTPAPQSGTHLKLVQLWEAVGITPDWPGHETTDASAAAILQQAAQFESYTIANMGTYLAHRERVAGAQAQKAQQFLDYLISAPDRA